MGLFSRGKDARAKIEQMRVDADRLNGEIGALRNQLDEVRSQLTDLSQSSSRTDENILSLHESSSRLDARISQVGTEVTHQLSELSTDLERLAQEQARYQIAFRQDLAEVADRAAKKPPI